MSDGAVLLKNIKMKPTWSRSRHHRGEDGEGAVPSGSPGHFCEGQG